MIYEYYEKKINDIILKCPIEAGVEILVYNVLDDIVDLKGFSLVDINRIWKDKDDRLTSDAGIADMAILSRDFVFGDANKGNAHGFVEVKSTNVMLSETSQIKLQKDSTNHYILTNGLVWKYYRNKQTKPEWTIYLTMEKNETVKKFEPVNIDEKNFRCLLDKLNRIDWE